MKPRVARYVGLVGLLGGAVWSAFLTGYIGEVPFPAPPAARELAPSPDDFVGAERCSTCHAKEYALWQGSTHGRAGGPPTTTRVIAAFDGQPIVFSDARVTPRQRDGRFEFVVSRAEEPDVVLPVDAVIGGGFMEGGGTQGFVTRRSDGTTRFLPFDWSRQGKFWFCNTNSRTGQGWERIVPSMSIAACGDWPPVRVLGELPRYANCQSCHASQLRVSLDANTHRYVTRFTSFAINCEACHGPGRRHVELAERRQLSSADIGFSPLGVLDKEASLEVCLQCHAIKDALRDGFVSGAPLRRFYSLGLPALGDRPLLADGRVRTFAYQEGHRFSACYVNGGMTCTSCHEPHGQSYQDQVGTPLPGRLDDRQCTGCHPSKSHDQRAHSHHEDSGPGIRCVACHMPYLQLHETGNGNPPRAVHYTRSDHTISIPRPALDSALGIRGACQACHETMSTSVLERAARAWWGELRPLAPAVRAQLAWHEQMPADSAWPLLLATDDAQTPTAAAVRTAGLARWFEEYAHPSVAMPSGAMARLHALADDRDPDVRALALATLHLADGDQRATRRFLRSALRRADRADDGVRARWRVVVSYAADRFASAGDPAADLAYRRALELAPGDASIALSRAIAWHAAGQRDSALVLLRRLVALPAAPSLAWLNYGIALEDAGNLVAADSAFAHAARLDPSDALGYFNRGNVAMARGDSASAREYYEAAALRDPALVVAHFQLARLALQAGAQQAALHHLLAGLAFDSSNAEAAAVARRLAAKRK